MELTNQTSIHLGAALNLGTVGIQCTSTHLYVYRYDRVDLVDRLAKIRLENVKEIRLDAEDGELKFTMSNNFLFMPNDEPLKVWLTTSQKLVNQMTELGCMAKVCKLSLRGNEYYKITSKRVRELIPESGLITSEDFSDKMKMALDANEYPFKSFGTGQQTKLTVFKVIVTICELFF